ncbi:MAG: YibE/F family protein [Gemmiger sp.]
MKSICRFFKRLWGRQPVGWRVPLAGLLLTALLLALPTGYEDAVIYRGTDKVRATVLETDDSAVIHAGLIRTGEQYCTLRLEGGRFRGSTVVGCNLLSGSLEQDKLFAAGDQALVVVSHSDGAITSVTMVDHYRLYWEAVLAVVFALLLVLFAGPGGLRALLSFAVTVLSVWKIMVPACLRGADPIVAGLLLVALLTVVIISFVYGFDRRCLTACAGSMLGVGTACLLGMLFTRLFRLHGAVMTGSETLLYSGYQDLNLTRIFMASIFIGASGAMMDLAVDITSGICEVVRKKPDVAPWEAVGCGMRIGQAAMGTMTTTLLLAYTGGCMAQLMTFMAQGTPLVNILNYKYVASELLQTMAGSFGLVTVAPFTAVAGGLLLTRRK